MAVDRYFDLAANEKSTAVDHALIVGQLHAMFELVVGDKSSPGGFDPEAFRHVVVFSPAYFAVPPHSTPFQKCVRDRVYSARLPGYAMADRRKRKLLAMRLASPRGLR